MSNSDPKEYSWYVLINTWILAKNKCRISKIQFTDHKMFYKLKGPSKNVSIALGLGEESNHKGRGRNLCGKGERG